MITETRRLHLSDEGWPVVGSGVRLCHVRTGRRWVYVREVHAPSRRWKRFSKIQYNDILSRQSESS